MRVSCVESSSVSIVTVVHADDIISVGVKSRGDRFCEDLNRLAPINDLGVCWLPFFEGLGCCYYDDFKANFHRKHRDEVWR